MIDISKAAEPKSDQLNADDLVGGPQTLLITGAKVVAGDQPVHIEYQGGEGRPWKPCKSMVRVLILAWGSNAEAYFGRSITVYRDPTVKWAGREEGGIRISHMSHLEKPIRTMLTVSRGKRVPFKVEPLQLNAGNVLTPDVLEGWAAEIGAAQTMADLQATGERIRSNNYNEEGAAAIRAHYQAAVDRIRKASLDMPTDPKNMDAPPEEDGADLPGL
jgi:hypothetical protein